jgi:long-chain acyl-CoA synthetase
MSDPTPLAPLALDRLAFWVRETPDRTALVQPYPGAAAGGAPVREITWRQLDDEARRMAAHLRSLALPPGSAIAILSKNCAHWMLADLAIWLAGHVSVPLYPTLAADSVRQLLEHSEARLLFAGKLDDWAAMKPGVPAGLPCIGFPYGSTPELPLWDAVIAATEPMKGDVQRRADELATIIYTSGTTGEAKGVMHSFGNFAWALDHGTRTVAFDQRDRLISYLPLAHVAERVLIEHGLLFKGATVYFAESLETFATDLRRARPTIFFSVPRLWLKFQQGVHAKLKPGLLKTLLAVPGLGGAVRRKILAGMGLDQCRYAAGGASPMPPALLAWYAHLGLPIIEVYGMTENCAISHATLPDRPSPGTVGPPSDGVSARIDPASGEVQMKNGAMMLGYYKAPELTAQTFTADGWLHTGDRGELDAEGNLRITGRVKDIFKTSKGKYVAPAPIEDKLVMHPAIEACCVTGSALPQPVGLVVLNARPADREAAARSLEAHLDAVNAQLDPHQRLALLIVAAEPWTVESGLVTPTMKVRRPRIEALYGPRLEAWVNSGRRVVWA